MTNKDIKQIFRQNKVQLGEGTLDLIQDYLRREVSEMAKRANKGNFKRLTPEFFHFVKGDWGIESGSRKFTTKG